MNSPQDHVREQQIKKLMALGNPTLSLEEFKAFQAGQPVKLLEDIEFKAQLADLTAKVATLQKNQTLSKKTAASELRTELSQSFGIQKFTGGMVTVSGGLAKFS